MGWVTRSSDVRVLGGKREPVVDGGRETDKDAAAKRRSVWESDYRRGGSDARFITQRVVGLGRTFVNIGTSRHLRVVNNYVPYFHARHNLQQPGRSRTTQG
jgi:hypothetical protein